MGYGTVLINSLATIEVSGSCDRSLYPMKPLRQIQHEALRWTLAWAIVGLVIGVVQLLRTGEVFWVPALGGGAAAAGLGMGVLYACLIVVTEDWRDSLADTPGLMAQLGPQVLCGAGAGLVAGLLAGGIGGALFFAALGACSAAVFSWRSVRDSLPPRAARGKPSKAKGR
jgi:hypothetical protein